LKYYRSGTLRFGENSPDQYLPLDILNGKVDINGLISPENSGGGEWSEHMQQSSEIDPKMTDRPNVYQLLIDDSASLLQCLPETVEGLSRSRINYIMELLSSLPVTYKQTASSLGKDYPWVLPHQGHPVCTKECGFLVDRQLTMLLWEATQVADYVHANGFKFDNTHKFLINAMNALVQCDDNPAESACTEHR